MAEATVTFLNKSLVEFGVMVTLALALIIVVVSAFVWLLVRISPTQQQLVKQQAEIGETQKLISTTLTALAANLSTQAVTFGVHDQRAADMHGTCKEHSEQIKDLYDKGNETVKAMAALTEKMADLAREMYALKTYILKA